MKNNYSSRVSAFTLAEIGIVLVVMSVLILFTAISTLSSEKTKYKKVMSFSSTFYSNASQAYQDILLNNSRNYTIENLNDKNGDGIVDSTDLALYFSGLLGGELVSADSADESTEESKTNNENKDETEEEDKNVSCSKLKISSDSEIYSYKDNAVCVEFNNVIAGFVYNGTCNTTVLAKEFLSKEDVANLSDSSSSIKERTIENACGYIVYGFPFSNGDFKKDVFTIALGKRNIR